MIASLYRADQHRRRYMVAPDRWLGSTQPWQGNVATLPTRHEFGRNARPSPYNETVALAREASPEAMQVLVARMHDPDFRIAVVAANPVLERTFVKVREQRPEEQQRATIDLTSLSAAEF